MYVWIPMIHLAGVTFCSYICYEWHVVVVAFTSLAGIWGECSPIHSPPALLLLLLLLFFFF